MLRHFFKRLKGYQTKFNLFSKAECIIMNVIMTMLYIEICHISIFVLFTSSKFLFMCYFLHCLHGAIIISIPSMNLALSNILFYLFFNILMHLYNSFSSFSIPLPSFISMLFLSNKPLLFPIFVSLCVYEPLSLTGISCMSMGGKFFTGV